MTSNLEERFGGMLVLLDDALDHVRDAWEEGGVAAVGFSLSVLCSMATQASLMYQAFDWVAESSAHPSDSKPSSRDLESVLNFIGNLPQLKTP
jgi:hypothetical protein